MSEKVLVGCCGMCCSTCGLFAEGTCVGCTKTKEAVDELEAEDLGCPMLKCAVEKGIEVCSRDCSEFPCGKYDGEWPICKSWLEMYKSRKK